MTNKQRENTVEVFAMLLIGYGKDGNHRAVQALRLRIQNNYGAEILTAVDNMVKASRKG